MTAVVVDDDGNFVEELKQHYAHDQTAQQVMGEGVKYYSIDDTTRLIKYDGRAYVPRVNALRTKLIAECHDTAGHFGTAKTLALLQQRFYWPRMKQTVDLYVRTCISCQQNKSTNLPPPGLLHPHDIPDKPWQVVTLDLITGLPETPRKHDSIAVFVDKLTKMVHYAAISETITAEKLGRVFYDTVIRIHGFPSVIISDRDPRFTSHVWQTLWKLSNTKLIISTAYHPQTDGQTERANRTLEDMLRHYVNDKHDDWDEHLTAAEIATNMAKQSSTDFAPFELNYGHMPDMPLDIVNGQPRTASTYENRIVRQQAYIKQAQDNLRTAIQHQEEYANRSRRSLDIKVNDEVMLRTRNLNLVLPGQSRKLIPKMVGPFKVMAAIGKVAFRLQLPAHMKCHPVFHISQLERYYDDADDQFIDRPASRQRTVTTPEWEVEEILDEWVTHEGTGRNRRDNTWYFVKWVDFPLADANDESNWYAREDFIDANGTKTQALQDWERRRSPTTPATNSTSSPTSTSSTVSTSSSTSTQPSLPSTKQHSIRSSDRPASLNRERV